MWCFVVEKQLRYLRDRFDAASTCSSALSQHLFRQSDDEDNQAGKKEDETCSPFHSFLPFSPYSSSLSSSSSSSSSSKLPVVIVRHVYTMPFLTGYALDLWRSAPLGGSNAVVMPVTREDWTATTLLHELQNNIEGIQFIERCGNVSIVDQQRSSTSDDWDRLFDYQHVANNASFHIEPRGQKASRDATSTEGLFWEQQQHTEEGEEEDLKDKRHADLLNVKGVQMVQRNAPWNLERLSVRHGNATTGSYTYAATSGLGVKVYVIDSGINADHVDFQGRAIFPVDFTDGLCRAMDDTKGKGKGKVKVKVKGGVKGGDKDSESGGDGTSQRKDMSRRCEEEDLEDDLGHGTHVAGIIGGTLFGVAKQTQLVGIKVFGSRGSTSWATILAAFDWAYRDIFDGSQGSKKDNEERHNIGNSKGDLEGQKRAQKQGWHDTKGGDKNDGRKDMHIHGGHAIINLSLRGDYLEAANKAVTGFRAAGIPVVVAAGNDGQNACQFSPGSSPDAITVAAVNMQDEFLQEPPSNGGPCINVLAPGGGIMSDFIGGPTDIFLLSGTSMAAPHVSGVLALLWSQYPFLSAEQVIARLYENATPDVIRGLLFPGTPNLMLRAM